MTELLDAVLAPGGLRVVLQPIVEVDGGGCHLHGFECLMRGPRGTNLESADVLFDYVRRKREESLVDRACVEAALREGGRLPGRARLTLNVHASTLGRDHEFPAFLAQTAAANGVALSRLTVEIVEHAPPWDGRSFLSALFVLREAGVSIALDDVGLGQSNYRMILDCRPDYFKIDRYFTHGCHADPYRLAVLESVHHLAGRFGGRSVAEGIEEQADLAAVVGLGIDLVQGFVFSPPLSPGLCAQLMARPQGSLFERSPAAAASPP
jgi:EAL domain-containing protein (putative c-di-GMP-specific phosphodiesterase class I)